MLHSLHHRLLLSGLLLLAGAVLAGVHVSNGYDARVAARPARSAPGVTRSPRGGAEVIPVLQSASSGGIKSPVSAAHAGDTVAVPHAGSRPEVLASLPSSGSGFATVENSRGNSTVPHSGSEESGFVPTPAFTPDVSFSNEHPWITNDPSVPGSSLSLDNQTATVTAAQPVSGGQGVALAVVVEDFPPHPVAVSDPSSGSEPEAADATDLSTSGPIAQRSGFTYQQELFRTKWGWSAYAQVQKILREDTSD
ncbi:MAG: hypothetical protein EOP88_02405 [Verrucomicrobiaceae bacterium]|nr:MAG: hypothetical protein EOP88_02405 [Verrucomicrobiaceae bacterium]